MEYRLDIWLVENMDIKSRSKAQELIRGGYVMCNGRPVTKTGYKVTEKDDIRLLENEVLKYIGVEPQEIGYNQPAGVRYPTENPFA